jgi:hypothetical protein
VYENAQRLQGQRRLSARSLSERTPSKPKEYDAQNGQAERHVQRKPLHRGHPTHAAERYSKLRNQRRECHPMQYTDGDTPWCDMTGFQRC